MIPDTSTRLGASASTKRPQIAVIWKPWLLGYLRSLSGRKKSTQRKKAARLPRGRKSAQIHQGVGPEAQTEPPEIPDDATEYGGES